MLCPGKPDREQHTRQPLPSVPAPRVPLLSESSRSVNSHALDRERRQSLSWRHGSSNRSDTEWSPLREKTPELCDVNGRAE